MAMPRLLYGTAWKKEATGDLVFKALKAGFRGVDTAAQPRHYNEALVGAGIREAISKGIVKREDLFIQTKFTPVGGQDLHNMPYDAKAPLEEQVHASVASSLINFTFDESVTAYIDSLVLHSPPSDRFSDLLKVWKALETYVPHRIRQLGISNTDLHVVNRLCTSPDVSIRPAVVQNRFYPATQWEADLRAYCRIQRITFQTFWTLSGNPELMRSAPVQELVKATGISTPVAVTEVLDGFAQSSDGRATWVACLDGFKTLIGESD
ncbi:hypothetical protein CIB48_g6961 [Xylaria polymorpha]|nr:hypothetical protein CIB48_g6961 [Xylaria polymorpha]